MSAKKEVWEPCPRCGSNRVQPRGGVFFFILGFCLMGISIWLLIIPPIGIAGIVIGLIFMLIAPFAKNQLQCQDCHKAWKYPVADNPFKTHQNQPE
ncbi:MAG: hypothetical protein RJR35_03600 [Thermoanaerobacterales bacterium]|nr:hypothetical protein [Thermoanaerobacterales bacterium]